jgi:hypothetical protein
VAAWTVDQFEVQCTRLPESAAAKSDRFPKCIRLTRRIPAVVDITGHARDSGDTVLGTDNALSFAAWSSAAPLLDLAPVCLTLDRDCATTNRYRCAMSRACPQRQCDGPFCCGADHLSSECTGASVSDSQSDASDDAASLSALPATAIACVQALIDVH